MSCQLYTYTFHQPLGLVEVSCLAGVPEVVPRHGGGVGGGEGEGGVGRGGGRIWHILAIQQFQPRDWGGSRSTAEEQVCYI